MKIEDVIIIGGGPSGLSASLQLNRYGIKPLLFEKNRLGGLLHNANFVENYPGFPDGITGPDLVELFVRQSRHFEDRIIFKEVEKIDFTGNQFDIIVGGQPYHSKMLITATGTKARKIPNLQIPDEVKDKVFYEVAPLSGKSNKHIAIIGAGDAGFDYALNLSKQNKVTIFNRGVVVKCLPLLYERATSNSQITYRSRTAVEGVSRNLDGFLELTIKTPTGEDSITADYIIGAVGRKPATDFLSMNLVEISESLEKEGRLYFIGDVKRGIYRQTSIAVGDGILSAMMVYQALQELSI